MANFIFRKANSDGTVGDRIMSGQLNALFTDVNYQMRHNGDRALAKFWIESDEDVEIPISVTNGTAYHHYVFLSADDGDAVADLTGDEYRYGALNVVDTDDSNKIKVIKDQHYTLARVGDVLYWSGDPYQIDDIVDNSDGTITISLGSDINGTMPEPGDYVQTMTQPVSLTANTPKSFWRERIVDAGSQWSGEDVAVQILFGS